ncbi:MAG: hypothetical protein GTN93_09630 [Anaerolineae bacterium]|nr:hypothetical protein [Anaerolineae bacterium]
MNRKSKAPTEVTIAFFLGMMFQLCLVCLHQDWLGLEGYIAYIESLRHERGWLHIPWWVWPPIMIVIMFLLVRLQAKRFRQALQEETPWDPTQN